MKRGCVPRAPVGVVYRCMSMASTVLLSSRAQVCLNVIRPDGFQGNAIPAYVLKKMPRSIRVFCNDRRIEISSSHVVAQCHQTLINYRLLRNAGSPEGSLLR